MKMIFLLFFVFSLNLSFAADDLNLQNLTFHLNSTEVGDIAKLRNLVENKGISLNSKNKDGNSLVHLAVSFLLNTGSTQSLKFLLEKGADPNVTNAEGETPLLVLISRPETKGRKFLQLEERVETAIKILLKHGADTHAKDGQNNTALHYALEKQRRYSLKSDLTLDKVGDLEELRKLVEKRAVPINSQNKDGDSLLHLAAFFSLNTGNLQSLKFLLKKGADPNVINAEDKTPLVALMSQSETEGREFLQSEERLELVIKFLLRYGADVNATDEKGKTALHYAVEKNKLHIVKILFKHSQINVNTKTLKGDTPLHYAARLARETGNLSIMELLLTRSDIQKGVTNYKGETYLNTLQEKSKNKASSSLLYTDNLSFQDLEPNIASDKVGDLEELRNLVENKGVLLNLKDKYGNSLLHLAVSFIAFTSNEESLRHLLEKGANPNVIDKDGKTPLHLAIELEVEKTKVKMSAIDLLNRNDATDVNAKDKEGNTPLHYAAKAGDVKTIMKLLKNPRINAAYLNQQEKTYEDVLRRHHFGKFLSLQLAKKISFIRKLGRKKSKTSKVNVKK